MIVQNGTPTFPVGVAIGTTRPVLTLQWAEPRCGRGIWLTLATDDPTIGEWVISEKPEGAALVTRVVAAVGNAPEQRVLVASEFVGLSFRTTGAIAVEATAGASWCFA